MTRDDVQAWLDRYSAAWQTYDPDAIGDLFAKDATYRYHPYDEPVRGRADIVLDWLSEKDDAGTYEGRYEAFAADGDRYDAPDGAVKAVYHNIFTLRFDADGRCSEFVEYFMELPESQRAELALASSR
jgi:ketosteroid isomerase-like protein